jgi:cobalt-zinc-cadmium efflux system protein
MLGDAISSLGVLVAGVVVALTGASVADPVVSILIGGFIMWSSWSVLLEATNVLMEAVPKGLDLAKIEQAIKGTPGVLNVHDLHVWSVASGIIACSCHIIVTEQSVRSGQQILRAVVEVLHHQFGVAHTTLQVEVEGCDPNELYCTLEAHRSAHHVGHPHSH